MWRLAGPPASSTRSTRCSAGPRPSACWACSSTRPVAPTGATRAASCTPRASRTAVWRSPSSPPRSPIRPRPRRCCAARACAWRASPRPSRASCFATSRSRGVAGDADAAGRRRRRGRRPRGEEGAERAPGREARASATTDARGRRRRRSGDETDASAPRTDGPAQEPAGEQADLARASSSRSPARRPPGSRSASTPSAVPGPAAVARALPRDAAPRERVAPAKSSTIRSGAADPVGSSEPSSSARSTPLDGRLVTRSRWPASAGRPGSRRARRRTLTPIPITAQSGGRASIRTPGDLALLDPHVVRPLHPRSDAAPRLDRLADGERHRQRQQECRTSRGAGSPSTGAPCPAGALQRRPWRPRPALCSSAVTSVPLGAPATASSRARSLVERGDAKWWWGDRTVRSDSLTPRAGPPRSR